MPTINMQVAERIKASAPDVEQRLVDMLVEKEVSRRVEVVGQGVGKANDLEKELRKIDKPDSETFNADGSTATATYTKARLEELKKTREKLDKLNKAIDKALAGDLGDLTNLIK